MCAISLKQLCYSNKKFNSTSKCENTSVGVDVFSQIAEWKNKHHVMVNKARMSGLTAQTGEVKPSTAACIPSETKGMMFSPSRVSLYRALRMFRAWTCSTVTHTRHHLTLVLQKYISVVN